MGYYTFSITAGSNHASSIITYACSHIPRCLSSLAQVHWEAHMSLVTSRKMSRKRWAPFAVSGLSFDLGPKTNDYEKAANTHIAKQFWNICLDILFWRDQNAPQTC